MGLKYLTGVKPTGDFHMGNFASTIKPILDRGIEKETVVLIADLHALTGNNLKDLKKNTFKLYCLFKAFGFENIAIQSRLHNLTDLYWILSCFTAKGLMNRSHSYKASVQENIDKGKDEDKGVFMGMYSYPILMTADMVYFDNEYVFIGKDQKQHMNIANDVVNKFNHVTKGNFLSLPEPIVNEDFNIKGYDGRKMSKSYNNVIPLMCSEKSLQKKLNSVKTNCSGEGEQKFFEDSPIFEIFNLFATNEERKIMFAKMVVGESWRYIKNYTFKVVNKYLSPYRQTYDALLETVDNFEHEISYFYDESSKVRSKIRRVV